MKPDAATTAKSFIKEQFPDCRAAFLGGSIMRGEATATSDLDIVVVVVDSAPAPYRKSFFYQGWPVELFVHNEASLHEFFKADAERGRPSLAQMVSEGLILMDNGFAAQTKQTAAELLREGPPPLSAEEIEYRRYTLTNYLDDFSDCENRKEGLFLAARLAEYLHECQLLSRGCWIGAGKWIYRASRIFDEKWADELYLALEAYYRDDQKGQLADLAEAWLGDHGGPFFAGFTRGNSETL